MPIYEYRCDHCGHELEAIQKMSDPVLESCSSCGQDALKRLISAPSFRLKGGGWYETDFKKDGKRNVHEGDSGKGSKSTPPCAATGTCPATSSGD
ncbi:MAG: zinc ribbon domain-containing protein [Gammaproteobacteria bacterium]|jgi:putative FmdB family regulatory protein|nr:zinc ribbon domain-containing protein [Gammaproteobacteria bacterium]